MIGLLGCQIFDKVYIKCVVGLVFQIALIMCFRPIIIGVCSSSVSVEIETLLLYFVCMLTS